MLSAFVPATDFSLVEWIGIVQDADTDARAAFDRIKGALRNAGLDVPRTPWTPTSGKPAVVAFVLPDGENPGDLEALLWEGLAGQPEAQCIEEFLSCVGQARGEDVARIHKSKVYAYLSTLESPELRLSHAILRHHIQSAEFQRLVDLIPEERKDQMSSEA